MSGTVYAWPAPGNVPPGNVPPGNGAEGDVPPGKAPAPGGLGVLPEGGKAPAPGGLGVLPEGGMPIGPVIMPPGPAWLAAAPRSKMFPSTCVNEGLATCTSGLLMASRVVFNDGSRSSSFG